LNKWDINFGEVAEKPSKANKKSCWIKIQGINIGRHCAAEFRQKNTATLLPAFAGRREGDEEGFEFLVVFGWKRLIFPPTKDVILCML
jgi:hypothetical protein